MNKKNEQQNSGNMNTQNKRSAASVPSSPQIITSPVPKDTLDFDSPEPETSLTYTQSSDTNDDMEVEKGTLGMQNMRMDVEEKTDGKKPTRITTPLDFDKLSDASPSQDPLATSDLEVDDAPFGLAVQKQAVLQDDGGKLEGLQLIPQFSPFKSKTYLTDSTGGVLAVMEAEQTGDAKLKKLLGFTVGSILMSTLHGKAATRTLQEIMDENPDKSEKDADEIFKKQEVEPTLSLDPKQTVTKLTQSFEDIMARTGVGNKVQELGRQFGLIVTGGGALSLLGGAATALMIKGAKPFYKYRRGPDDNGEVTMTAKYDRTRKAFLIDYYYATKDAVKIPMTYILQANSGTKKWDLFKEVKKLPGNAMNIDEPVGKGTRIMSGDGMDEPLLSLPGKWEKNEEAESLPGDFRIWCKAMTRISFTLFDTKFVSQLGGQQEVYELNFDGWGDVPRDVEVFAAYIARTSGTVPISLLLYLTLAFGSLVLLKNIVNYMFLKSERGGFSNPFNRFAADSKRYGHNEDGDDANQSRFTGKQQVRRAEVLREKAR